VGIAMWITTVALVAGFLVLTFSHFKMNSDMGLITAITIALALVMDFLFLPTLLLKTDEKKDIAIVTTSEINYDLVNLKGEVDDETINSEYDVHTVSASVTDSG